MSELSKPLASNAAPIDGYGRDDESSVFEITRTNTETSEQAHFLPAISAAPRNKKPGIEQRSLTKDNVKYVLPQLPAATYSPSSPLTPNQSHDNYGNQGNGKDGDFIVQIQLGNIGDPSISSSAVKGKINNLFHPITGAPLTASESEALVAFTSRHPNYTREDIQRLISTNDARTNPLLRFNKVGRYMTVEKAQEYSFVNVELTAAAREDEPPHPSLSPWRKFIRNKGGYKVGFAVLFIVLTSVVIFLVVEAVKDPNGTKPGLG